MSTPEKKIRVRVAANPEKGFFRIGRHWPRKQTEAEVTEAELKILTEERKLSVVVLAPEPPKPAKIDKPQDPPPADLKGEKK